MQPIPTQKSTVRLQVFLSHRGVCSRRKAMELIQDGQVTVNGVVVREPSTQVTAGSDKIAVCGKLVQEKGYAYVLLNKPAGYVTTKADPHADRTVLEILPDNLQHLNPVGRLDKDTGGLLLLTNDGDLAHKLTHPKFDINKVYVVRINGRLLLQQRQGLEKGVLLEGKRTLPAKIEEVIEKDGKTEFLMTIHEGRKRQIRLMVEAVGQKVISLTRIQQGPLKLDNLKRGQFRHLTAQEVQQLKNL